MSEMSGFENPIFSRDELLSTAERLFRDTPFLDYPAVVTPKSIAGKVDPALEAAIKTEFDRAIEAEQQKLSQKQAEWEGRSIGRIVGDMLKHRGYIDVVGLYEPRPEVGSLTAHNRMLIGSLPLDGGWPRLAVSVEQTYFDGSLNVAGREFTLDPAASLLRVSLAYLLSDGSRPDLSVMHTLYPYRDGVYTDTREFSRSYWTGIPHQPFSDKPEDASFYMNKAMEMLIDGPGYIDSPRNGSI